MTIDFGQVVTQMGVMLLIVLAGYGFRRFGWIEKGAETAFSQILVRLTAPCLVFYGVVANRERLFSSSLPQIVLAVAVAVLLAGLISAMVFRKSKHREDHRTVLRMSSMFGNVSFLGIPLCYVLFGEAGLMYASLYAAAQDLLFWSVGVAMMHGHTTKNDLKKVLNPSLLGILLAIVLIVTGIPVPMFLLETSRIVGAATLPLSLLVVGAGFFGLAMDRKTFLGILPVAGLKLAVMPALIAVLLMLIPMDPVARAVISVEIAMPSAAATVALARTSNRDWRFAAGAVMLTTVLSALTLPLLVLLMNHLATGW